MRNVRYEISFLRRGKASTPAKSARPVAQHELLAEFHLKFRFQSAKHFFAPLRIHRRQFGQEFVPRSLFCVATPPDADRQKGGGCPHGNVSLGDHKKVQSRIEPAGAV